MNEIQDKLRDLDALGFAFRVLTSAELLNGLAERSNFELYIF